MLTTFTTLTNTTTNITAVIAAHYTTDVGTLPQSIF
jgi:ABC-type uncharacterized transport system ATPase subunit